MKTPSLHLDNVTLYACCWSRDLRMYSRTLRVLDYCRRIITFKRVILFAYLPPAVPINAEVFQIPLIEPTQWNVLLNKVIPQYLQHEAFCMSVHEDGFPLLPQLWCDEFLAYDYIGAPWQDGVVGNAGFNIESGRLMKRKLSLPFCTEPIINSDYWLCRNMRPLLESEGFTFAPRPVALKFSTETIGNNWPSFGFHGREYAQAKYLAGWNKIKESERQQHQG